MAKTYCKTLTELAAKAGVDRATTFLWRKKFPEFDSFKKKRGWDLEAVIQFKENVPSKRLEKPSSIRTLEEEKLKLQTQRLQREEMERNGELIEKRQVDQDIEKMILAFKNAMFAIPGSLAPRLVGMEAVEIEKELQEAMVSVCEKMSNDDWE